MIVTDYRDDLVSVTVYGEFTLADYTEFEDLVNYRVKFEAAVNLLFDLRQMADFTLDVAVEEIRFSRTHANDFGRIAVITESRWVAWSAWLAQAFVSADVGVFDDEIEAREWLTGRDE